MITENDLLEFTKTIFPSKNALVMKRTVWVGVGFLKAIYKKSGQEGLTKFIDGCNVITDEAGIKYVNKKLKL